MKSNSSKHKLALVFTGGNGTVDTNAYLGPPIGLVYLGSWVKAHAPGWDVRIVDCRYEDVTHTLLSERFDVIGITAMTFQYESASRLARILQAARKLTPGRVGEIVLGGCHITLAPYSIRPEFDTVIPGEGEYGLVDLLTTGVVQPGYKPVDLKTYPDLDLDLMPPGCWKPSVVRVWHGTAVEGILLSSRGCPWRCRFCCTTEFWKHGGFRLHTEDWVVRQTERMVERGVTHMQILDDLFTVAKPRLRRIVELWEAAGLHKQIHGVAVQTRAELIDSEACDLLRRINTRMVSFGHESWDDRVLHYLKKGKASVAKNKAAIRTVHSAGLQSVGSLMMGSPTETLREMLRTVGGIVWMLLNGASDVWVYAARPYPGTEFWEIAKARGKTASIERNWDNLKLRTRLPGRAELIDIPRWQFVIAWFLAQLALVPFKIPKVLSMVKDASLQGRRWDSARS